MGMAGFDLLVVVLVPVSDNGRGSELEVWVFSEGRTPPEESSLLS